MGLQLSGRSFYFTLLHLQQISVTILTLLSRPQSPIQCLLFMTALNNPHLSHIQCFVPRNEWNHFYALKLSDSFWTRFHCARYDFFNIDACRAIFIEFTAYISRWAMATPLPTSMPPVHSSYCNLIPQNRCIEISRTIGQLQCQDFVSSNMLQCAEIFRAISIGMS